MLILFLITPSACGPGTVVVLSIKSVFSLAFFSMAGHHAVNLGRYAVLQTATLSFEQRGG